jgi:SAM-dependent methyltransferase
VNDERKSHWDEVYNRRQVTQVSWYQSRPEKSLELIRASGVQLHHPIIDVGGGASFLIEALLDLGYCDLTVLDISSEALEKLRSRLSTRAAAVALLQQDVTAFRPMRRYALWHDRAVFHFLVHDDDRKRYVDALKQALYPAGHVVIATFGPEGPERCSGLPVKRYDAASLAKELGEEFLLVESSVELHHTPQGASQQFLYCRFQKAVSTE